jgi:hypothetical protein
MVARTFPTAASPSNTSFTLLLGLGAEAPVVVDSAILTPDYVRQRGGGG